MPNFARFSATSCDFMLAEEPVSSLAVSAIGVQIMTLSAAKNASLVLTPVTTPASRNRLVTEDERCTSTPDAANVLRKLDDTALEKSLVKQPTSKAFAFPRSAFLNKKIADAALDFEESTFNANLLIGFQNRKIALSLWPLISSHSWKLKSSSSCLFS